MSKHQDYMRYSLTKATQNLGMTYPNPSVGCVIVKDDVVVGVGATAVGGRPHAETIALEMAGKDVLGATAYVTLEPCAHEGATPSCAKMLASSGILKCYIATLDVDDRTKSKGVNILTEAGVEVEIGLLAENAEKLNKGFFTKILKNRPMFTAKMAVSADGKIALSNGESKWITNDKSRAYTHYMRATHDAIIVGAKTVSCDNPILDCRLHGMEDQSPVRIVLGYNIPKDSKVLTDGNETHMLTGDIDEIIVKLNDMGFTRVLIEGGATTITKFFKANLIDQIAIFSTGKIMGGDCTSAIGSLDILSMDNVPNYKRTIQKNFDNDTFALLEKE